MKFVFSAGIVVYTVINNELQYLLLQYGAGHWDFAKGHIEPGESKQEAAYRELKEETGLTTEIIPEFEHSFSYFFRDYLTHELDKKTVYFFVGKASSTNVTISSEHQGFKWLPFDEAQKLLTYKNAQDLLANVNAFLQKNP